MSSNSEGLNTVEDIALISNFIPPFSSNQNNCHKILEKCLNNFNKIYVQAFPFLHHQYNKSLKFAAMKVSVKRRKLFSFDYSI